MATTTIELYLVPGTTTVYAEAAGGSGTAAASYTATQVAAHLHTIAVTEALTGRWIFNGGDTNGSFGFRLVDNLTDTATTFAIDDPDMSELQGADGDTLETLSDQLDAINTLVSAAEITVSVASPLAADGSTITLLRGDDYYNDDSRAITWTGSVTDQWADLTGATLEFKAGTLTAVPTVVVATGTQSFRMELDGDNITLRQGEYPYDVQATLASGNVITLVEGLLHVKQTRTDTPVFP